MHANTRLLLGKFRLDNRKVILKVKLKTFQTFLLFERCPIGEEQQSNSRRVDGVSVQMVTSSLSPHQCLTLCSFPHIVTPSHLLFLTSPFSPPYTDLFALTFSSSPPHTVNSLRSSPQIAITSSSSISSSSSLQTVTSSSSTHLLKQ